MAWAVKLESESGQFFPDGNNPDLRERLHSYFNQEMTPDALGPEEAFVDFDDPAEGRLVTLLGGGNRGPE